MNRDRIFALRGLAEKDFQGLGVMVDYTMQCHEVYVQVAQGLVRSGELDILSLCQFQELTERNTSQHMLHPGICDETRLPSWTPNWSTPMRASHALFGTQGNVLYSASGSTSVACSFKILEDSSRQTYHTSVTLGGHMVDEIFKVGLCRVDQNATPFEKNSDIVLQLQQIAKFTKESYQLGFNTYTKTQLNQAPWRILNWDIEYTTTKFGMRRTTSLTQARHYTFCNSVRTWLLQCEILNLNGPKKIPIFTHVFNLRNWITSKICQLLKFFYWSKYWFYAIYYGPILNLPETFTGQQSSKNEAVGINDRTRTESSLYSAAIEDIHPGRPFLSRQGYIGFGPAGIKPGDMACIFHGARVPHILRKRDQGQPGYILVGDAYVHGAMDRELMKDGHEYVEVELF
jgi:hypothetical protein